MFLSRCTSLAPRSPPNWSWRRDLNPRPSDYKSDALPAELRQQSSHVPNCPPTLRPAPAKRVNYASLASTKHTCKAQKHQSSPHFESLATRLLTELRLIKTQNSGGSCAIRFALAPYRYGFPAHETQYKGLSRSNPGLWTRIARVDLTIPAPILRLPEHEIEHILIDFEAR